MIKEEWNGYNIYPYKNEGDLHDAMNFMKMDNYDVIKTEFGFIAYVPNLPYHSRICDNNGSFTYIP